jgi:hypothetical protein
VRTIQPQFQAVVGQLRLPLPQEDIDVSIIETSQGVLKKCRNQLQLRREEENMQRKFTMR